MTFGNKISKYPSSFLRIALNFDVALEIFELTMIGKRNKIYDLIFYYVILYNWNPQLRDFLLKQDSFNKTHIMLLFSRLLCHVANFQFTGWQ